jgi:hypothetical protein
VTTQLTQLRQDTDHQLFDGLTHGARMRTEALLSGRSHVVVDASHVATVEHEGISVIPIAEVFSDPQATFLGFGIPNVFLALPRPATADRGPGWDKFAAFMYWRKAAFIADTKGRVQGGVFIELRHLPPPAVDAMRQAMVTVTGRRTISCANATGRVLSAAGFTCNGRLLTTAVRPMKLAEAIWNNGLEYHDSPVDLRVIRTHSASVSDHFLRVWRKEVTSLFRVVGKIYQRKTEHMSVPLIEPRPLAPATPATSVTSTSSQQTNGNRLELRVGRPTRLAAVLRQKWGDHPIFEATLDRSIADVDGPDFAELRPTLNAYPGKLDAVSKLKRYVLFSKPVVKAVRRHMAVQMDSLGRLPSTTLVDMFQTGPAENPFLYNVVITGTSARMSRLENRTERDIDKANWILAKHVLLAGYDPDVRYAGEIWVEETAEGRVLRLNDNSGTYRPTRAQAGAAARFLSQLTGVPVEFRPA